MTPGEIAGQLAGLREAGHALRERPAGDTLDALAAVLDHWQDADSAGRRALRDGLPEATGFRVETLQEGLVRGFGAWSGEALRALAQRAQGRPSRAGIEVTSTLLAGSIPMPTLLAVLSPLLLHSPVLVRPAARDPFTAAAVARSIAEVDPTLGRCVAVARFDHDDVGCVRAFLAADRVVAFGSDATLAALSRELPPDRRLVAHGHRLSLSVLGDVATRGAGLDAAAEGLALDTALWDQLGCLSPVAVYVVSGDPEAPDRVATALAAALDRAEARWPRGAVGAAAAASLSHERDAALMREAAGQSVRVRSDPGTRWTVIRECDASPRPAPLHRFLRVHPVLNLRALTRAIAPESHHLAALAVAGFDAPALATLSQLGAARLCPPGALQSPPLTWHPTGIPTLSAGY